MTTQQEFLRVAMGELEMTRDAFAERLACPRRTLDMMVRVLPVELKARGVTLKPAEISGLVVNLT